MYVFRGGFFFRSVTSKRYSAGTIRAPTPARAKNATRRSWRSSAAPRWPTAASPTRAASPTTCTRATGSCTTPTRASCARFAGRARSSKPTARGWSACGACATRHPLLLLRLRRRPRAASGCWRMPLSNYSRYGWHISGEQRHRRRGWTMWRRRPPT